MTRRSSRFSGRVSMKVIAFAVSVVGGSAVMMTQKDGATQSEVVAPGSSHAFQLDETDLASSLSGGGSISASENKEGSPGTSPTFEPAPGRPVSTSPYPSDPPTYQVRVEPSGGSIAPPTSIDIEAYNSAYPTPPAGGASPNTDTQPLSAPLAPSSSAIPPIPTPRIRPPTENASGTAAIQPTQPIKATGSASPSAAPSVSVSVGDQRRQSTGEANAPRAAQTEAQADDSAPFKTVRVYYATDRNEIRLNSWLHWLRMLGPVAFGCIISMAMVIAIRFSPQKYLWSVGLAVASLLTIYFGYGALIYSQQTLRLMRNGSVAYGAARYQAGQNYPLHLGVTEVTLPRIHQVGTIERPNLIKAEFIEDKEKHVVLQRVETMNVDRYFEDMMAKIQSDENASALVFIHGYNVLFDDAVRRMAQITADLKYKGAPIVYSWPSSGQLIRYTRDEANIGWTAAHLEQFLWDIKERTGAKQIHLIAHSMGNRAMLAAIDRLVLQHPESQPFFGQIIMAAPDVDTGEFQTKYAKSVDLSCTQATLYTSERDRALLLSHRIHGFMRLGETAHPPPVFEGIDTVNITPIDPSLLGHSYYGNQPALLQDLRALVELGEPPSDRKWLIKMIRDANASAWRFRPELATRASQLAR